MSRAWAEIAGDAASPMLLIADHASNRVPLDIDLGVPAEVLRQHVAVDIGVAPLARDLCARLGCPAVLGDVSRLVIDLNREDDAPGLIPAASDGVPIPGNANLAATDRLARIERFWRPYHQRISELIAECRPNLLISLHSFTPRLSTSGDARPWQVGVLYNRDERAARIALPLLGQTGTVAGDNLPYSGKVLNATMNQHGEARGIAYLGLEVRQDLIADPEGVTEWAARLAPIIAAVHAGIA
jgi:predicted N-formylglutamate amidohydrolase